MAFAFNRVRWQNRNLSEAVINRYTFAFFYHLSGQFRKLATNNCYVQYFFDSFSYQNRSQKLSFNISLLFASSIKMKMKSIFTEQKKCLSTF